MSVIQNLSRRDVLKGAGATAGLVIGAQMLPNGMLAGRARAAATAQPNLFCAIDADGTVTITCSRSEMGQGVRTGIPMMLADELEADWNRVKIWQAPGDPEKYDPAGQDAQNTDGSRSTRHHLDVMRELGAQARDVLERAAAEMWGVDPSEVYARNHRLYHTGSGESFDFGDVVETAAGVETMESVPLKDPSQWRYIGKDMPVIDNFDMSTGGGIYGADVSIPGMKIAVVARCPVYRGRVKSFNAGAALAVQGVEQVVEIPPLPLDTPAEFRALGGVAVIGTNTWSVLEGRRLLEIDWDMGPNVGHSSSSYNDMLREAARTGATEDGGVVVRDRGDFDSAFAAADRTFEAEYFVPYFIHTTMEPMCALVDATVDPVQVWGSVQSPNDVRKYVAEALDMKDADGNPDASKVECNVTLLGGGFGRKSQSDFACEAAILSKMIGAPVRMQWTREDDIQIGYYHTASAHALKAGVDADGKVTAWKHSGAWPSILALWVPDQKVGFGIEYGLGLVDTPYNEVPNIRIENGEADPMIRIGWYRSVNNIQHSFAMNGFAHEIATELGQDPVEFLARMIGESDNMDLAADGVEDYWNYGDPVEKWPIMPNRLTNALRIAAAKAGYGKPLPPGHGIGVAAHRSFHAYVATAVHVAVRDDGTMHVVQVDTAYDAGRYVNPEGIKKQVEGAAIYGHTVALHGQITTTDGAVDQSNFHDYPITRISDAPLNVRVHLVEDFVDRPPNGVGEPGVPPYAPALANAIFAATGKRIRNLPIRPEDIAGA